MKIRTGFVSNSSSSSFIVTFPKKPKNSEEVFNFMFGNKDHNETISLYDDEKISLFKIANNVFRDIKSGNVIKMNNKNKQKFLENFMPMYYYSTSYHDSLDNNSWYYKDYIDDGIIGTDKIFLDKIKELTIEENTRFKETTKKIDGIRMKIEKEFGNIPYASDNFYNKETKFTQKQINEYNEFEKMVDEKLENNEEYKKLRKEQMDFSIFNRSRKEGSLSYYELELAKKDLDNYLNKNSGFTFLVSYSDNENSEQSIMEHGEIFKNVPHIEISNH